MKLRLAGALVILALVSNDADAFVPSAGGSRSASFTSITSNASNVWNAWNVVTAVTSTTLRASSPSKSATIMSSKLEMFDGMSLLQAAILNDPDAAAKLLNKVVAMRKSDIARSKTDELLDRLLRRGPDRDYPSWTKSKRMARFSRRARMASLARTIDCVTPPPPLSSNAENQTEGNTSPSDILATVAMDKAAKKAGYNKPTQEDQRRRRRAFLSVLRLLADAKDDADNDGNAKVKEPAIILLERKALEANQVNADGLRQRMPEGLESPQYDIISTLPNTRAPIEIRQYQPYSVCAVGMGARRPTDNARTDAKLQNPELKGATSFGALAGYLFGKNQQSTAMKMTTPVITSAVTASNGDDSSSDDTLGNSKQMAFVLPSTYWDGLDEAPRPLDGSGVSLQRKEAETRATIMFGGYATSASTEERKLELSKALQQSKEWSIATDGVDMDMAFSISQYNDPFTPPWRRLNEVSIKVVSANDDGN